MRHLGTIELGDNSHSQNHHQHQARPQYVPMTQQANGHSNSPSRAMRHDPAYRIVTLRLASHYTSPESLSHHGGAVTCHTTPYNTTCLCVQPSQPSTQLHAYMVRCSHSHSPTLHAPATRLDAHRSMHCLLAMYIRPHVAHQSLRVPPRFEGDGMTPCMHDDSVWVAYYRARQESKETGRCPAYMYM